MEDGCKGQIGLSYFKFPNEEGLRRLWPAACNKDVTNVTKYATVCQLHFNKENFKRGIEIHEVADSKRPRLPSTFLHLTEIVNISVLIISLVNYFLYYCCLNVLRLNFSCILPNNNVYL